MDGSASDRKDPVSLLVVACGFGTGGTERHLSLLLPRLLARGITPRVYALGDEGVMAQPIRDAGITVDFPLGDQPFVTRLPPPFRGLAVYATEIFRLRNIIKREKPDICHCFLPMATVIGGVAAGLARHPLVLASRRSLRNYQADNPALARVERRLIRGMNAVLGNSRAVIEQLAEEGVPGDRIGLIYNGVPVDAPGTGQNRRSMRHRLGIEDDALVLVSVANLIPYKGHRDLFAALSRIAAELPPQWVLLCAGRDSGIAADLEHYADELGIGSNVRLLGDFDDVEGLYCAADISVLASHQEGFSNAVLESLVAGVPTIATAVGGNGEAIGDDDVGRLVPPRSPESLAAAIRELAESADLRERLGVAARDRACALFAIDDCVDRYENLYRGLLSASDKPVNGFVDNAGWTTS